MKTDCVRISLFFSTYVAFPSGTSYNIMAFEICKFPWCCSSVLWPLPIYWMWIVHHINANLQSIREALCCVVLCPKLSNFDSSATCPLLLQSFLQYLHIHQLIESAQSTKYIVFVWVSSLKIPPRTPADPLSNHITHPFHPSSHNFWNIGNSKRRKIWQLQGRMPWGLWCWSFGV